MTWQEKFIEMGGLVHLVDVMRTIDLPTIQSRIDLKIVMEHAQLIAHILKG